MNFVILKKSFLIFSSPESKKPSRCCYMYAPGPDFRIQNVSKYVLKTLKYEANFIS